LLFFTLLTVREIVLNLASDRGRGPVKDVTLFAFGGVCRTSELLTLPGHELLMAAARLLSSLVIAAVMYGIYALSMNYGNLTIAGVAEWLTFIWFSLFLLNFLPGFPLDAGMALRALVLKRSGNFHQATYAASTAGWYAGLLFIFGGVFLLIITYQWLMALVFTVTGWCLQSASAAIRRQAALAMSLEPVKVRDVMTGDYTVIDRNVTVGQLFRQDILVSGWDYYLVTDSGTPKGILTERNIKAVPWRNRNSTSVGDIMIPLNEAAMAYLEQSGVSVLQEMEQSGIDILPVLEGGRVVGVVSRERLSRLGKTRAEFGV